MSEAPCPTNNIGNRESFVVDQRNGSWAERGVVTLLAQSGQYAVVAYGPSDDGVAGQDNRSAYNDRYQKFQKNGKRPDLLVFEQAVYQTLLSQGIPVEQLSTMSDDEINPQWIAQASFAVEVKSSGWFAKLMTGRPSPRLYKAVADGRYHGIGFAKNAKCPHTFIKERELQQLQVWRAYHGLALHIVQVYYDMVYLIPLTSIEEAIEDEVLQLTDQHYGTNETRLVYKAWCSLGSQLGEPVDLKLIPSHFVSPGGRPTLFFQVEGHQWQLFENSLNQLKMNAYSICD